MNAIELKRLERGKIHNFIRERLSFGIPESQLRHVDSEAFKNEHKRFEMSGYDFEKVGSCTVWNTGILNLFADLGIYDFTHYLFVDFYKGTGTIYLKYWNGEHHEEDCSSLTTTEIIHKVFELTIFSNGQTRRRD